jgi:tellurite resistance protein
MKPIIAAILAHSMTLNAVVSELVALLTPEQQALLRERLEEQARTSPPLDAFEPDYSEFLQALYAERIDALGPKP